MVTLADWAMHCWQEHATGAGGADHTHRLHPQIALSIGTMVREGARTGREGRGRHLEGEGPVEVLERGEPVQARVRVGLGPVTEEQARAHGQRGYVGALLAHELLLKVLPSPLPARQAAAPQPGSRQNQHTHDTPGRLATNPSTRAATQARTGRIGMCVACAPQRNPLV